MSYLFEAIGYIAGTCCTLSFIPQALKTYKSRNVSGLSASTYAIYNIGIVLWLIYGFYIKSTQIVFFNALCLVFTLPILYMVLVGHKKQK